MALETQSLRSAIDFVTAFASTELTFQQLEREWETNNLGNSVHKVISDKNASIIAESMGENRLHELENELRNITEMRVKDRSEKVFDDVGTTLAYSCVAYSLVEGVFSKPAFNGTLGNMFTRVGGSILVALGVRDLSKPVIKDIEVNKHNRDINLFLKSEGVI